MKIVYIVLMIVFFAHAETPKVLSVKFIDGCMEDHNKSDDVKLVKSYYTKVANLDRCKVKVLDKLISDELYTKNSILMLKTYTKDRACKQKFRSLSNNFDEWQSYIKVLKASTSSCVNGISNYWTHKLTRYSSAYSGPSEDQSKIANLKAGEYLKFISFDTTLEWAEFKYVIKGESLTGWIKVELVEKFNE